ncbi:MAG: cysteine--tRNA ligase [Gemmatimonadota bacterium]
MSLELYDTLTRSARPFEPLHAPRVLVYACGPTVYNHAHIGNFRSFVFYDVLRRYLIWSGYDVRFVMNLTDVDDKTIEGARRRGVPLQEYTRPYADAILSESAALGIRRPDATPLATHWVPQMLDFIGRLIEKGLAYTTEDGSVYYRIAAFPDYGKLSGIDPDAVRSGARVAVDEYAKDDARDFALWKAAKPVDEEVGAAWDSPWGRGRPGWHIECSAMSMGELAETLDIHLGGEDLVFPHHEDEIAQSEGLTGRTFVRYWVHVKHLLLEDRKMSKSLGNTLTVRQLLDAGVDPAAVRHMLISSHYRHELNFKREGLAASSAAVRRLADLALRLEEEGQSAFSHSTRMEELAARLRAEFRAAMDDDLNTPNALAALFGWVRDVNAELDAHPGTPGSERAQAREALESVDSVLGLLELARRAQETSAGREREIEALVAQRDEARARRDFQAADDIRDRLAAEGVILEDTPGGTRWKLAAGGDRSG